MFLLKKGYARISSAHDRFSQFSFESEKYLKFENSLFLKLQDMISVQAAPGSVSMSQYTVNPLPAAS